MGFLFAIDDCLIALAERFAQWFQRMTGETNMFLAKCMLVMYLVLEVIGFFI